MVASTMSATLCSDIRAPSARGTSRRKSRSSKRKARLGQQCGNQGSGTASLTLHPPAQRKGRSETMGQPAAAFWRSKVVAGKELQEKGRGSSGPVGLDHLPGVEQRPPEHGAAGQAYTDPQAPKPTPAERGERMRQWIRARNAARSRRPERQRDADKCTRSDRRLQKAVRRRTSLWSFAEPRRHVHLPQRRRTNMRSLQPRVPRQCP